MEVPGAPVSSKPGETSVKWQLCYDMTAKMWWMVSGEVPTGTEGGLRRPSRGRRGQRAARGLSDVWAPVPGCPVWLAAAVTLP